MTDHDERRRPPTPAPRRGGGGPPRRPSDVLKPHRAWAAISVAPGGAPLACGARATVRVSIAGEADVATAPRLDEVLRVLEVDATTIVLDLRRLETADRSGARLVLELHARVHRAGGTLTVICRPGPVERLLRLTDPGGVVELVHDAPAAGGGRGAR